MFPKYPNAPNFPKAVRVVEVGPRDGLQNEKDIIPTKTKIELVNRLSNTGLKSIEVTSFVSPAKIPQLADAEEVLQNIQKNEHIHYSVLVPNLQGYKKAMDSGAKAIAVFSTVSETFSQKNTHCSIEQGFERIHEIMIEAKKANIPVRGYLSCVLGCPYEGDISLEKIIPIAKKLFDLGCFEISLGDTIGVGTPLKAQQLITALTPYIPIDQLAIHFHDTYGQALANIYACMELGIATIDSSIAGLGGCPYARGASGNVATEDVVYLLNGLGVESGIDLSALVDVSHFVVEFTGRTPSSKVAQALLTKMKK